MPSQRINKWTLDSTTGAYSYLLLDGDRKTAEEAGKCLATSGIAYLRLRRSHRVAADGCLYDWYLRLPRRDTRYTKRELKGDSEPPPRWPLA